MKNILNLISLLLVGMSELAFAQIQISPFVNLGSIKEKIFLECKGFITFKQSDRKAHTILVSENFKSAFLIEGVNNLNNNSIALRYDTVKASPNEQPKCIGCVLLNGQAQMSKSEILKIQLSFSELHSSKPQLNYSILNEDNKFQLLNLKPFICSKK